MTSTAVPSLQAYNQTTNYNNTAGRKYFNKLNCRPPQRPQSVQAMQSRQAMPGWALAEHRAVGCHLDLLSTEF